MSHWDYIKPGGVWGVLSLLSSGILAEIDKRLFKSLNADDGGTWAPASQIILGGAGLRVDGPFRAGDAYIVITSGKLIQVNSGATASFLSGSTFNLAGATSMTGTFTVSSTGQIRIANTNGLRVMNGGSALVDAGGLVSLSAGAGLEVNGSLFLPGRITMKALSLFTLEANAIGRVDTGASMNVLGSLNVLGGGFLYVGKLPFAAAGSESPGSIVIDAAGLAAGSGMLIRNGAKVTATGTSFLEATGTGSRIQALNGAHVFVDSNSRLVSSGVDTLMTGGAGSLTLGRGDYSVAADIKRTGADIPSGDDAYSAQRPASTGPNTSTTIDAEKYDRLRIPTLSAARTWTLNEPPKPHRLVIYSRELGASPVGANLTVRDSGGTLLVSFTGGTSFNRASAVLGWTGNRWIVDASHGEPMFFE